MSHSYGIVHDAKSVIVGFFEYDGTVGVAMRAVQPSRDGVAMHWRRSSNDRECRCSDDKKDVREVQLFAEYGGGIYWESRACFACWTIVGARNVWESRGAVY